MKKIKIFIADSSYLTRIGFRALVKGIPYFELLGEAETPEKLSESLSYSKPDVLVIDYTSRNFCLDDISVIKKYFPSVNILAITAQQNKQTIAKALECGITGYLLKECEETEIIESIYATANGERYLCEKIVKQLIEASVETSGREEGCSGIKLSSREIQIIKLIAEGYPNKQIADKLFISTHTVMTHRKNIMGKLQIKNTAALVMLALQNNWVSSATPV